MSSLPPSLNTTSVAAARELWISRLVDTSRNNPLLYYTSGKAGTFELPSANSQPLTTLLNGSSVSVAELFPEEHRQRSLKQIHAIRKQAKAYREERGMDTLYLAWGLAEWTASDNGRAPAAPIFLLSVTISVQGRIRTGDVRIERTGAFQVNPVLIHALVTEHGLTMAHSLPKGNLEAVLEPFDPSPTLTALSSLANKVPGFAIRSAAILGVFKFQKMALMEDLRKNAARVEKHPLIAAIAGDLKAQQALHESRPEADLRALDTTHPDTEFLILPADSSQQQVVAAVTEGQSGVIQGPPGTGKSQTIANLITTLTAKGKRVLFVAEKRAALEVVLQRLAEAKLRHLALDLHSTDIPKRAIIDQFKATLAQVNNPPSPDAARVHRTFQDRRTRLNNYVARLHTPRPPSMYSIYTLQGQLLSLPAEVQTKTRWVGAELAKLTAERIDSVRDLLIDAGDFGDLFLGHSRSPWAKARLNTVPEVHSALALVERLASVIIPALQQVAETASQLTQLPAPRTLAQVKTFSQLLPSMSNTLEKFRPALFDEDIPDLVAKLAPAREGSVQAVWTWIVDAEHRNAYKVARQHSVLNPKVRVWSWKLYPDVEQAEERQRYWQYLLGEEASVPEQRQIDAAYEALTSVDLDDAGECLRQLAGLFQRESLDKVPFDKLANLLTTLRSDQRTPHRMPRVLTLRKLIAQQIGAGFLRELAEARPPTEFWPAYLEHAWLESCLEEARNSDPAITAFGAASHSRYVEEFQALDAQRTELAAGRVRRAHANNALAIFRAYTSQTALLRRELGKQRPSLSLRQFLEQAGDVVTHLCPCWMASPLSVSQLIPADRRYFDVVIFDEASQILPEDAISAILRGISIVVAGDERQLPPSDFFSPGGGEDEDESDAVPTKGFDSLLDLMIGCIEPWRLTWHYRSEDESLIAFSNKYIYDNDLITFPNPNRNRVVHHELVEHSEYADLSAASSEAEVRRVVELILQHAELRRHETLGVITLGRPHADRIDQALAEILSTRPDLEGFFGEEGTGQVFVKNLERVQGDERDAIILTLGATKSREDRVALTSFGPLNQDGGERRLNVAITRARKRMTLVSSFQHTHMHLGSKSGRGVVLLKRFLEYAADTQRNEGPDSQVSPSDLDLFEHDVFRTLTAHGLKLQPQLGSSQKRIGFAVQHPRNPNSFVMAIECDGPAYATLPTARDRDRLRQQQLERLGWHYHRVWSLNWVTRKEEEIQRVLTAYRAALATAMSVE